MKRVPTERHLKITDLRYHLNEWDGGGETTVLLLQVYLDLGRNWNFMVDALPENDWHIVAPDWRGHGDSEWIGAGGYYHFADYVRDLDQLVSQLRRKRLVVVGHSMGAMVATLWAGCGRHAEGLVLVEGLGPPPVARSAYPQRMARWLDQTAPFELSEFERPLEGLDDAERRLARVHPKLGGVMLEQMARFATRTDSGGRLLWKYDPLHRTRSPVTLPFDIAAEFAKQICVPTLWVGGAESPWGGENLKSWLKNVPNWARRLLPSAGHMVQNEEPFGLARELSRFIDSVDCENTPQA